MTRPIETISWRAPEGAAVRMGATVCNFLDLASTSMGRATHYNTAAAQATAERAGHEALLELDRGLYTALLMLPGTTDRAKALGVRQLLTRTRGSEGEGLVALAADVERRVVEAIIAELPASRMLRLLAGFADQDQGQGRINNARARKLALRTVLRSARLELWSVKYRSKLRKIFVHAWGRKTASYLREALAVPVGQQSVEQQRALQRCIGKYAPAQAQARVARECVGFVLGATLEPTLPLLVAFEAAKQDLAAGAALPIEVLEGLRSGYHPQVDRRAMLELSKRSMTKTQRRQVQRKARALEVEVEMDPMDYDATSLYIHAFASGMNDALVSALRCKAERAASSFPAAYAKVGVVVDASASMAGHSSQPLRPMAVALALRDMLEVTGECARTVYCGGEFRADDHDQLSCPGPFANLCRPRGETSLAEGLLELLESFEREGQDGSSGALPDVVYLISDGYENARAGRLDEVLRALHQLAIEIPIYHLSPVFAAELASESRGVRSLSDGLPTLPVARPDALGLAFLRALTQVDPERGVHLLVNVALDELRPMLAAARNEKQ